MIPAEERRVRRRLLYAQAASLATLALGSAVLIGWLLENAGLKSIVPGFVSMKSNTALGFVLCGAALTLLSRTMVTPPIPLRHRRHGGSRHRAGSVHLRRIPLGLGCGD